MANQGGSLAQRTFSFIVRLLASLVLPAWGVAMIALVAHAANGWWIATGVPLITPFCAEGGSQTAPWRLYFGTEELAKIQTGDIVTRNTRRAHTV